MILYIRATNDYFQAEFVEESMSHTMMLQVINRFSLLLQNTEELFSLPKITLNYLLIIRGGKVLID